MKTKRVRLLVSFLLVLFGFLSVFRAASAEEMSGKANLTTIAQEKTQDEKTQEEKTQIEKSYNEETEAVSPSKDAVPDLSVSGSERHPGESQCEPMETMRATYNDVFASLKGNGYSLSEGISSARSAFTTGDFVYAWA
ncbi:MAG: hypothetical protein IIY77_04830, partial [Lachnospiraceae bacterium]|nr:hypothetical protein [Lachnospiraceae bacterium]